MYRHHSAWCIDRKMFHYQSDITKTEISFVKKIDVFIFTLCIPMFLVCICVCAPSMSLVPVEARRGLHSSWNWSHRWLQAAMFVLASKTRSSARRASAISHWVISLGPAFACLNLRPLEEKPWSPLLWRNKTKVNLKRTGGQWSCTSFQRQL